jgi:hypothetical protein
MSEFKFACPVCGQHITADSRTSGEQIDCPTCFQRMIVPQAPTTSDSKLILSAALAGKPRPTGAKTIPQARRLTPHRLESLLATLGLLVVLGVAAAGVFHYRDEVLDSVRHLTHARKHQFAHYPEHIYPVPNNLTWTLNLDSIGFPDTPVAGRINGNGFYCEKATLKGGTLTLRQGRTWPPDLGISVLLVAREGEELAGKYIFIPPERSPPIPRIILRWKDDQQQALTQTIEAGYAMKLAFGQPVNGKMPGKIYLCLPDDPKSFVAGVFEAHIRRTQPPKETRGPKPN